MIFMARKALAFLQRDLRIEMSYKLSFLFTLFSITFTTVSFYFVSKLIDPALAVAAIRKSGGYFPFVIIGIALSSYLTVATRGFSSRLREAQMTGTFEALLMTPTPVGQTIAFSCSYDFLFTTVRVGLYLLAGSLIFGMDLSNANWPAALVFLALSTAAFSSLGILSSAFTIAFRRGDPTVMVYSALSYLLGGVYYPVDVLPWWLQWVAQLLPISWALRGMRGAILEGKTLAASSDCIMVLVLFSVVLWPAAIWFFSWAVRKARREGSLGKL
jgi:ABC-2 type transport system permease protein